MNRTWDRAVLMVIDGDLAGIQRLLAEEPSLARARSGPPFEATLLHYSAANGVEDELQRSPANAPSIAAALLAAGAEPDAQGLAYGGGPNATPLCLLVSSWHPFERGVQADLVRVLVKGGAALNGSQDNGAPMATALCFGYTHAAETLAECGARVDNLLFAAGLGDLAAVRRWFHPDGTLRDGALGTYQPCFPGVEIDGAPAILQQALHFAVTQGRTDVAQELLARGAQAGAESLGHHARLPLLQCLFVHQDAMLDLLLEHGADPLAVDSKLQCSAVDYAARTNRPELSLRLRAASGG